MSDTWEARMAERARQRAIERGDLFVHVEPTPESRAAAEREYPRSEAEQSMIDYCQGEGPPYCAEVYQAPSGAWLVRVTCSLGRPTCGHRHHEGEIWLADAADDEAEAGGMSAPQSARDLMAMDFGPELADELRDWLLERVDLAECHPLCLFADPESTPTCDCVCEGLHHGALREWGGPSNKEKRMAHVGTDTDSAECDCGWWANGTWALEDALAHVKETGHQGRVKVRASVGGMAHRDG
jgi:hypothetical protein